MAYGQPSGTANYNPAAQDLVLDALERCGIYDIENKHTFSAKRSLNLLLSSSWANRGINLWKVQELVTPLTQGVPTYTLTPNVISVLDTYRRQYQMNPAANAPVAFTTTLGSSIVTVALTNAGVAVGSYVMIAVQVAVGGLVLYGFYAVTSTPDANSFTIDAGSNATVPVISGGAVPVFTTTSASASVNVALAAHGLLAGQSFVVPVSTAIAGLVLAGSYTVATVTDADNFTITAPSNANASTSVTENGGQTQIAVQNTTAGFTDILMTPISRNDYAAQSNKLAPGAPTTYWVDRTVTPSVSLWPVTDATGPYEMRSYVLYQIDDVNPTGGQTLDLPQRMFYACTLDLARDLAMKFAPDKYALLKEEAMEAWAEASTEDVEHTSTFIMPSFAGV